MTLVTICIEAPQRRSARPPGVRGTGIDLKTAEMDGPDGIELEHGADESAGDKFTTPLANAPRHLSLRDVAPVDISVRDVTVGVHRVKQKSFLAFVRSHDRATPKTNDEEIATVQKRILDAISADFPAGSLTAILGASGSGKTSLLNVLADRAHGGKLDVSGQIKFNGSTDRSSIESAYVMQQDVLIPTLTVRETLRYAAELRLRGNINKQERHHVVEQAIRELSLKEAADTRLKYCSGGERRRTSLATQLLANPSILWLDEPTTGLDATSALQLVTLLKSLSDSGRTIVLTIHQPRSEIWSLLDRVIVLSKGSCVYSGGTASCMTYFSHLGYPLPTFCNPAEHIIDIAAIDDRSPELEEASRARVAYLVLKWKEILQEELTKTPTAQSRVTQIHKSRISLRSQHGQPFMQQVRVLTLRTFLTTVRDPLGLIGTFFEALFVGIIMGWIFFQLDTTLGGIRGRAAAVYIAAAFQGYLILMFETYRMTTDIQLFDRERKEGVVSVLAFVVSRRIAKLVEDLAIPLVFSIIFYWMCGLRSEGDAFMVFFAVVLIMQFISVNFATMAVAISREYAIASLIGNLSFTWQSFACGFFVLAPNLPVYLRWSRWTAYVYYGFGLLFTNEFADQVYPCPHPGGPSDPACAQYTGDFQLQAFDIPPNWIWRPMIVLVAFMLGHFILACVCLQLNRQELKVARARYDTSDQAAGKEVNLPRSLDERQAVVLRLEDYQVHVARRTTHGMQLRKRNIQILKPVNAVFEHGVVNVIMGPSGSGKTSLLSSIAQRLKSDFLSQYQVQGKILLNGAEPKKDMLQSIISFVTQDDNALLSKLTVRETLRFAAHLRLPNTMSKSEKHRRAEEVLLRLGLKDAANMTVGNDLVKGISGGERRRVSIAIQVLTDPRVLLLDEPTSGLDGFTAASIMAVLRGLANEGRTVILTIHQSRSDLWSSFGKVLLLARGGHTVYSGPASHMLEHFTSQGHVCPKTTNPADFALDLITIDLRQEEQEASTREKVESLIESWKTRTTTVLPEQRHGHQPMPGEEIRALRKSQAGFFAAVPIVTHRSWLNLVRQPELIIGRIMQVLGLGIVVTLFFAPLRTDYYSIQTRLGYIQEIAPLYFVGMLNNIALYPFEQAVFDREFADRAYTVEAFLTQYTLLEVPFEVLTSLLFALLADLAAGLPRTATAYFVVAFNVFCIVNCGESVGIVFNTLLSHTGFAVNIMSIFLSLAQTMGGTMAIDLNSFLQAFNHLSPIKWSVLSLAQIAFDNISFGCLNSQRLSDGSCPQQTGMDIIKLYKLDKPLWVSITILAAVTAGYRLVAYLVLHAVKGRWMKVFRRRRGKK